MLGRRLVEVFDNKATAYAFGHEELDVTNLEQVRKMVSRLRPDWIIHAAAFTQVDDAEEKTSEAYRVNALGARNVSLAAAENQCRIVYFSTDFIFDGTSSRPLREWDRPAPINEYGASKLAGEFMVRSVSPAHIIIRTSWLFGPDGPNFVEKIAAKVRAGEPLRIVDDQRGSPCFTVDLAQMTRELVERRLAGTYHVTNSGHCTKFELAENIVATLGLETSLIPARSSEFLTPANRPMYSVLDNLMLRLEGLDPLRHWRDAVRVYLGNADV